MIRSNLTAVGAELLHETVKMSFELIEKFICLPITHDPKLICKILSMLVSKEMEKDTHLYNGELF